MYFISVSTQNLASTAANLILLEEQQAGGSRPSDWLVSVWQLLPEARVGRTSAQEQNSGPVS
jgi:hypothetical protein